MELTPLQKSLVDLIMERGVVKDQMVAMMLFLKDNEDGMLELKEFIQSNNPTAHEIIKKSIELVMDNKTE